MKANDTIKVKGHIRAELWDTDGKLKEVHEWDNIVTTLGLRNIRNLLMSTGNTLTHIGIGWSEPDANPTIPARGDINFPSGTDWPNAEQDRKTASLTVVSDTSFKLEATWGSGEPSTTATWPKAIRALGAFWAGGVGDNEIFSWSERAPINKASGDTLKFTYTITLS